MMADRGIRFTFNTSIETQDFPKLVAAVNFGSPELRWDVSHASPTPTPNADSREECLPMKCGAEGGYLQIFDESWKEHEWKYPPVPGKDGFVGSVAYWAGSTNDLGAVFDPARHNADDVLPLPRQRLTRNVVYNAWWMGRLANGSVIAPGKYKYVWAPNIILRSYVSHCVLTIIRKLLSSMRIAVLAPFGDPNASDNWDRFSTPVIEAVAS
jgi:hypothetical protein